MSTNFCTYLHLRFDDDIVFYVGQGIKTRPTSLNGRNSYWHRTVYKHGYYVRVLEENLTKEQAIQKEVKLIAYYRNISGDKLTNFTEGGEIGSPSGYRHTAETKKKMHLAQLGNTKWVGKKHTEETKEKIRLANLGNTHGLGKVPTEEHREKIRKAHTGRVVSEATREKLRQAMAGKKPSPEANEKNRQSNLGRKVSEDTRAKMSLASKGRVSSMETREKIRLSWIIRKADMAKKRVEREALKKII